MEKIRYEMNENVVIINENHEREDGIELTFKIKNDAAIKRLHEVRNFFERDKVYTDVLFYTLEDKKFQIIVRDDSYAVLLAALFRWQLVKKLEWID
ncbi:hypothetical protein [Heyndrickxia camelliae]|uniref:Uncharacterized protein n=1 Tax=Heyndrickxia camelliae TaxID=1707093 RepID=A0A2N3LQI9_9BACI|nr:hypothetical protein [Heyndrickxia camelliae]PKR86827.1 hypothetical protein CWO92_01875 [Heyndrickxia camelliae]